eukprot:jgi/Chrzof1/11235/Cz05g28300.t1
MEDPPSTQDFSHVTDMQDTVQQAGTEPASSSDADALATAQSDQEVIDKAEAAKAEGNQLYVQEQYELAADKYWQAIDLVSPTTQQRSVYFANLAACYVKMGQHKQAIEQCTSALAIDPVYIKALMRRSGAFQALDDLEHALQDAKRVLELDADNTWAKRIVQQLEPVVQERQEKMKEEMMGKLKDLGNTLLGKFGLSLDNFKTEKDPNTGSYSIKFQ